MKVLLSWLKDFVDIPLSVKDLSHRLTMSGFEVEAIDELAAGFESVVIGQISEINPHPNADRLTLCKVNVGQETLSIVCGAKNIQVGDFVPLALDGAKLPGGKILKAAKIRGEHSQGMMCSGSELELSSDENGILIIRGDSPQLG